MENKQNVGTVWVELKEFVKISGLEEEKALRLIEQNNVKSKKQNDVLFIDLNASTDAIVKRTENSLITADMGGKSLDPAFVEKTINVILGLHDKVIAAKNETIAAYKNENGFLKEALISTQEIHDEDKQTIEVLREELKKVSEEVEFMKRKYRLMWGKVSGLSKGIDDER